jgi:class 3 adenylate cyclase
VDVGAEYDPGRGPGHRRYAAVLFADLSGFTELVETVEPEIVYARVRPLMDDLVAEARRFGGEIQQILGDGFMCVYGLTDTQGDEAERAVRAGLALAAMGGTAQSRPSVHVGIEYGEVFVTPSWPPAGSGVWGRPVNHAQRLCALAGPGEVQVGREAFRHGNVRPAAVSRRPARFKGVSTPVLTHRIRVALAS